MGMVTALYFLTFSYKSGQGDADSGSTGITLTLMTAKFELGGASNTKISLSKASSLSGRT